VYQHIPEIFVIIMNLIDALDAASVDYKPGRDDTEIYLCCPFCSDERFRLGVNVETGYAHCFNDTCDYRSRGDYTFRKLQEVLDTGEIEAQQEHRKRKKRKMEKLELPDGFQLLSPPEYSLNDFWNKKAWGYIRNRGITREQIRDKKIGFTETGNFAYRVIFPVYLNGTLVGLSSRDITGKQEPAHKNSTGTKCIYNLPEKKHNTCVLSESAITSLVIERASRKMSIDSLGLLGHSLKDDQLGLLKHYKRVIVWMDPDSAGIEGIESIYPKLKQANKSIKVILPKGMLEGNSFDTRDPDEMDQEEIVKRLEHAQTMTEGLVLKLKSWKAFEE
jgi:DNA primase